MDCIKCGKIATKKWYDEPYCLECFIKEADCVYYDNGKMYKRLPKRLFTK